jgi:NAD+ synthase (glutamine-hydrolysing)
MLRITIAQLNPTVGDIAGNVARMAEAAARAAQEQADLLVFPELSLCGYYPGDLLDEPAFRERLDQGLQQLLQTSRQWPQLHWVIGAPTRAKGPGKPLHNSLLVLKDGAVRLRYDKQLLPTYNIFDERRHFEPGPDAAKVLLSGLRGRLERRRSRLRHQSLRTHGRCRARPGGQHQCQPQPSGQARAAP